ncbi:MAG: SCO family protein [Myxococcota bacterium]
MACRGWLRVVGCGLALTAWCACTSVPEPLFRVDSFELIDERGDAFGSRDLDGTTWAAAFIFTSCRSVCPKISRKMVRLGGLAQEKGLPLELVFFSVDPEHDTPEALKAYATKMGAIGEHFHFLTGDPEAVRETVIGNFKQPMNVESDGGQAMMEIAHGTRIVLVDAERSVRGLYEATDQGVEALLRDARRLPVAGRI